MALLLAGSENCVESFLLTVTVLTYRRLWAYRSRDTVSCLHKSCPLFILPPLQWAAADGSAVGGWCAWLQGRWSPTMFQCDSEKPMEVLGCFWFAHWGLCYSKVWLFPAGDNLCLVLGVFVLTIALSRQGEEQLAGREDWGLGKLGTKSLNPGVSFWANAMEKVNWAQQNIRLNSLVIKNNNSCSLKKNAGDV